MFQLTSNWHPTGSQQAVPQAGSPFSCSRRPLGGLFWCLSSPLPPLLLPGPTHNAKIHVLGAITYDKLPRLWLFLMDRLFFPGSKPDHDLGIPAEQGSLPYFLEAREPSPHRTISTLCGEPGEQSLAWPLFPSFTPSNPQVLSTNLTLVGSLPPKQRSSGRGFPMLPAPSVLRAASDMSESQVHVLFCLSWTS